MSNAFGGVGKYIDNKRKVTALSSKQSVQRYLRKTKNKNIWEERSEISTAAQISYLPLHFFYMKSLRYSRFTIGSCQQELSLAGHFEAGPARRNAQRMWACPVDPTSSPGSAGAMSIVGKWAEGCNISRLPDGASCNTSPAHTTLIREHQGVPAFGQDGTLGGASCTPQLAR